MTERLLATGQRKALLLAELQAQRERGGESLSALHPHISFLPLSVLAADPSSTPLIDQALFKQASTHLAEHLRVYGPYELLDPTRVWVGLSTSSQEPFFGGFYHPNQGYRYLQQRALVTLSGAFASQPIDRILVTLELIRAYAHDTMHYNTYRLFCPLPQPKSTGFYRLQYGVNFRRWDGRTYSVKDSVRALTTRNLGNIMEGATDLFAHQVTLSVAQETKYEPVSSWNTPLHLISHYVYRDCMGQMTHDDIHQLQAFEKGAGAMDLPQNFQIYLKSMRIFNQYVNMRYRKFLEEFDPEHHFHLHHLMISSMLSGKMKALCQCFDTVQSHKRSFVRLFKSSEY